MIKTFNDLFALVVVFLIIGLWIIQGLNQIVLRDDVNGALVVLFTLIIQFYFRKSPTPVTPPVK
jgi:hypothetical protein